MKVRLSERLLVVSVSDAAARAEKAFINLNSPTIEIGEHCAFPLPALCISDGMSIPDAMQWKVQGEDGIEAGHVHDMFYSAAISAKFRSDYIARDVADEVMGALIELYCPGFRTIEAREAELMVKLFGRRAWHDAAQDEWRRSVAAQLGGVPGDGCGTLSPPPAEEIVALLARRG